MSITSGLIIVVWFPAVLQCYELSETVGKFQSVINLFDKSEGKERYMGKKSLYDKLLGDVKRTGKLCLKQRKQIWKSFGDESSLSDSVPKEKEIRLALRSIIKVVGVLEGEEEFITSIKIRIGCIDEIVCSLDSVKVIIEELYELIKNKMKNTDDFYIGYMLQAFKSFIMLYDIQDVGENELDTEDILQDEDLEIDELDTSYCACVLWIYQDQSVSEKIRRKREKEFWEWYVKEAALIQGVTMQEICDKEQIDDEPIIKIESIADFVKYVSYELDYLDSFVKKEQKKEIEVSVYNQKNGSHCPSCEKLSNHISKQFYGMMKLGKVKGWQIIFLTKENVCICDNPDCPTYEFTPTAGAVDYKAKVANYKHIISIPRNEEKLCELLGIL